MLQPAAAEYADQFEAAAKDLCDTVGPVAERLPNSLKNAIQRRRVPEELAVSSFSRAGFIVHRSLQEVSAFKVGCGLLSTSRKRDLFLRKSIDIVPSAFCAFILEVERKWASLLHFESSLLCAQSLEQL